MSKEVHRSLDRVTDSPNSRNYVEPLPEHIADRLGLPDNEERRRQEHENRANGISVARDRLNTSETGTVDDFIRQAIDSVGRPMGQATYDSFRSKVNHAYMLHERDEYLAEKEKQHRIEAREVDPYGAGSPHSWICDSLYIQDRAQYSAIADRVAPGVEERLARSLRIAARAVDKQDKYGRKLTAQWREMYRGHMDRNAAEARVQRELRTILTSGGGATASSANGGVSAFVTPVLLLTQWAAYRSPRRYLADTLNASEPLPSYGMMVYVPSVGAPTTVNDSTGEGNALPEGDPQPVEFLSATVEQHEGKVTVSQAVLDRVGPGMAADVFLFHQLKDQLGASVDAMAISAMTTGAATVTDSGTFLVVGTSGLGTNSVARDVAKAKAALTDTAGVRVRASHLYATSDVLDTLSSWGDAEGRPLLPFRYDPDHQGEAEGHGLCGPLFRPCRLRRRQHPDSGHIGNPNPDCHPSVPHPANGGRAGLCDPSAARCREPRSGRGHVVRRVPATLPHGRGDDLGLRVCGLELCVIVMDGDVVVIVQTQGPCEWRTLCPAHEVDLDELRESEEHGWRTEVEPHTPGD